MKILGDKLSQCLSLVTVIVLASNVCAQDAGTGVEKVDVNPDVEAKELIRQWVTTERLLGAESSQWREEKARVSELLGLYKKELKLLDEELEKTGKSVSQIDETKAKLEADVSSGIAARTSLRSFLMKLQPRVVALEKRFPDPLKGQLSDSMNTLGTINDETSVREILQATVDVLEKAGTFNAGVLQHQEAVTVGEETWNAEVIYLGLGRAYFYVGSKAGVGMPPNDGSDGWKWVRNDDILKDVKKAIDVFSNKSQPQLVELPLQIKP